MTITPDGLNTVAIMLRNYKHIGETAKKWSTGVLTAEVAIEQVSYLFIEDLFDLKGNTS